MYLIKKLNIGTLVISSLLLTLALNIIPRLIVSAQEEQTNILDQYSSFHESAMIETRKASKKLTDQLLDIAKKYGIEPDTDLEIRPEDFIGKENKNLASIYNLAGIIPPSANLSNSIAKDIEEHLTKTYEDALREKKNSFNNLATENTNEALANKNNLEPLANASGSKIENSKSAIQQQIEANKSFTENTDSVKKRKEIATKIPKTPPPIPTSTPDCLSTKLQPDYPKAEERTKDIEKAPNVLEPSGDYFEDMLLQSSLGKDKAARNNLRKAYTQILQGNIENGLTKYYQKLKLEKEEKLSSEDLLKQRNDRLTKENEIVRETLEAFIYFRNLTDLEMRYSYEKKALEKIEAVLNQIKEFHTIQKDAVKDMSNLPPAI